MRADVRIVATNDRLPRYECTGSIQARLTGPHTVHLVGVAANPLGGDEISVRIEVHGGASLRVRSVAASVAMPGRTTSASRANWHCDIDGHLDLDPAPTVVAAEATHYSYVHLNATAGTRFRTRERIQIGRTGESSGFWSGVLNADVEGLPLLRHQVDLGPGAIADDDLGHPLAMISELRYPAADSIDLPTGCTCLALAGGGALLTWQGTRLPAD